MMVWGEILVQVFSCRHLLLHVINQCSTICIIGFYYQFLNSKQIILSEISCQPYLFNWQFRSFLSFDLMTNNYYSKKGTSIAA